MPDTKLPHTVGPQSQGPTIPMPPFVDEQKASARSSRKGKPRPSKADASESPDQRLERLAEEEGDGKDAVETLLLVARGSALILDGLFDLIERARQNNVINAVAGVSAALILAVDNVDLHFFQSAGELVRTIPPEMKAALLRRELSKLKKRREP